MPGWVRCLTPHPHAEVRLVCFPHAGGTAAFFAPWQRNAPDSVEVYVVQYPGRADRLREAPIDDAATLAAHVADALAGLADRPTAFFGHSMGGLIAYETARLLAVRGLGPRRLMVSASPPPGHRDPHYPDDKQLSTLDDERLVVALGKLGGSDARLLAMPEMLELILPAVRADFRLVERYVPQPGPMLDCPITAYSGQDDRIAPASLMQGWAGTTTGALAGRTFAGGHFYLQERPADVLADVIAQVATTPVIH